MTKRPSEIYGYSITASTEDARNSWANNWCPFKNVRCNKVSSLTRVPFGVCSVCINGCDSPLVLCPDRFLQDNIVFNDIARHRYGTPENLVVLSEVGVSPLGRFDFVMVKHKPFRAVVDDFVVIEFQGGETTSTGHLVRAFDDFRVGRDITNESYAFGFNSADIWKRTFTQILNKGIVVEHWGEKAYWVVQDFVFQNFLKRYSLKGMTYGETDATVFALYDLRETGTRYELYNTQMRSSSIDALFEAFRNKADIPEKDAFVAQLNRRLEARLQTGLV